MPAALVIDISNDQQAPRLINPSRIAQAVSDRPPFKSRERLLCSFPCRAGTHAASLLRQMRARFG